MSASPPVQPLLRPDATDPEDAPIAAPAPGHAKESGRWASGRLLAVAAVLCLAAACVALSMGGALAPMSPLARNKQSVQSTAHVAEDTGCANWETIKMKSVGGLASVHECEVLCHTTAGCVHANFQTSECADEGHAAGDCYLYGGVCEKKENNCWTLVDMPPGVHQYAPTAAQTGCANWADIALGDAFAAGNQFECAAACHDNPECVSANFQSGAEGICLLEQTDFQGACYLYGSACEKQSGPCWDLIEMRQKFKGCYRRSADDLDDAHAYTDKTCVDADKFTSTSPCRSGLPWYRLRLAEGQGASYCSDFCVSKGLDLSGVLSVADPNGTQQLECRCGATAANMVAWHEKEPKESLTLSESMAVPIDDPACQIRVQEYVGGLEDDGVPWELTDMTAEDIEYMDDISESLQDTSHQNDGHAVKPAHSTNSSRRLGLCKDESNSGSTGGESCAVAKANGWCERYDWVQGNCPVSCGKCEENGWVPCFPGQCASGAPWPNKQDGVVTIDLYFKSGVDSRRKSALRKAMELFEPTCIRFKESSERPAGAHIAVVREDNACWANVGYPGEGGVAKVNLGFCSDSRHIGTMAHELGHAIGLGHEHSRQDATQQVCTPDGSCHGPYVQIKWDNIESDWKDQYYAEEGIYIGSPTMGYVPYDYGSLMHYPAEDVIVALDQSKHSLIGNRKRFSDNDITKINDIYGCSRQSGVKTEENGPYCVFPFTYKDVTYDSCTTVDHHSPWCRTVSVNSGEWGNCQSCMTTDGQECVLPFVYSGVTYNSCTMVDDCKPWCALKHDHTTPWSWGYCSDQCKTLAQ